MIMYLSGNFPQLSSQDKEEAFMKTLHRKNRPYHRLVTIFYPQHCETVLNIIRDESEEQNKGMELAKDVTKSMSTKKESARKSTSKKKGESVQASPQNTTGKRVIHKSLL